MVIIYHISYGGKPTSVASGAFVTPVAPLLIAQVTFSVFTAACHKSREPALNAEPEPHF